MRLRGHQVFFDVEHPLSLETQESPACFDFYYAALQVAADVCADVAVNGD
jgi:hypothetical protein